MKIIKLSANNLVLHVGESFVLTDTGVFGIDFINPNATTANAVEDDAASLPDNFVENCFAYADGTWTLVNEYPVKLMAGQAVRAEREEVLAATVDKFNGVRWTAMPAEKQAEWLVFRQAWLDISDQSGFPFNVVRPIQPE